MQNDRSSIINVFVRNAIPVFSLSLFLPSIIANLGYKAADAQLLSTPPYILAMIVALINAWLSDKYKVRGPLILCSQSLAIIGFAVLLGTKKAKYGYMATFFTCSGTYATVPVLLSWASNNTGGDTKKAVRIALMVYLNTFTSHVAPDVTSRSALATWAVYAPPSSTGSS
jgi:MFS transporter, ACS family, DAL5 transporter family protein